MLSPLLAVWRLGERKARQSIDFQGYNSSQRVISGVQEPVLERDFPLVLFVAFTSLNGASVLVALVVLIVSRLTETRSVIKVRCGLWTAQLLSSACLSLGACCVAGLLFISDQFYFSGNLVFAVCFVLLFIFQFAGMVMSGIFARVLCGRLSRPPSSSVVMSETLLSKDADEEQQHS